MPGSVASSVEIDSLSDLTSSGGVRTTMRQRKDVPTNCQFHSSSIGRNIIVCIDGIVNDSALTEAHVLQLFKRLERSSFQLAYYGGIGEYARPSRGPFGRWRQMLNSNIDMGGAWSLDQNITSAYQWLTERYEDGDRIFLFGFARGAYQIRVLAGMIDEIGLLDKAHSNQIPFAYKLYTDFATNPLRSDSRQAYLLRRRFKTVLSRSGVQVHFAGVWESISPNGVQGPDLYDATAMNICGFRHAIALDENNPKLIPEFLGLGPAPYHEDHVKEVWFAGSHADLGGPSTVDNKFGPSMRWMVYEAIRYGLRMKPFENEWSTGIVSEQINVDFSSARWGPTPSWARRVPRTRDGAAFSSQLGGSRVVQVGQLIHESVFEAISQSNYTPKASIRGGIDWKNTIPKHKIEEDPYISAGAVVSGLASSKNGALPEDRVLDLLSLSESAIGVLAMAECRGALEAVVRALNHISARENSNRNGDKKVVNALVKALATFPPQPGSYSNGDLRKLVDMASTVDLTVLNQIFCRFGSVPFSQPQRDVLCVAISNDGSRIASGSEDNIVLLWDATTGENIQGPFTGHKAPVKAVAFSPDGDHVVSGSFDGAVRVWNTRTSESKLVGQCEGSVYCVAYLLDGRVVTSSADNTIRVWNAETGKCTTARLNGTPIRASSATLSENGVYVVVASGTQTIRVRDEATGQRSKLQLARSAGGFRSVTITPDGRHIISGSDDEMVRMWDAKNGNEVMTFRGHADAVVSVAASPDGTCIVSGSEDCTIRVWDTEIGDEAIPPLTGHGASVVSLAISRDGRLIVSASLDGSIRVWDLETGDQLLGPQS